MSTGDNISVLETGAAAKKADAKFSGYILNCVPSQDTDDDWLISDGEADQPVDFSQPLPGSVDLRASWWKVRNQGKTGACVGFATADSVLRWHYVHRGLIGKSDLPSPRFIWMANKETDGLTSYPSSFLEVAGSATRDALNVARRYGCVLEPSLPMSGGYPLSRARIRDFYTGAARLRIHSFRNLFAGQSDRISVLKHWIAQRGPILTRLTVDRTWRAATSVKGELDQYRAFPGAGGHAVALVGYTSNYFIVRNSYGTTWGDKGFAYASYNYTLAAFNEAYGVVI